MQITSNNPELFKIDIITENRITNPPIITIVLTEFIILLDNTSPKFENVTVLLDEIEDFLDVTNSLSLYFQNLNRKPTIMQDNICVINNNSPY